MQWGVVLALAAVMANAAAMAQDKPPEAQFQEVTPSMQAAVDKGLAHLAKLQNRNGSFGNGTVPVATTALAGLSFLAGGHTPGRSRHSQVILNAADYLLKCTSKLGYINEGAMRGQGGSGMHGHGYALLFLSQVYGMSDGMSADRVEQLKDALNRAVRLTEQAQAQNGGWIYDPTPSGDEGSVTITQVQALRAVQAAGIRVNMKTIEKAIDYINKTTNDAGQTAYSMSSRGGGGTPTLTAAGMCVLTYLGQYDNPKIPKGLGFVMKSAKPKGGMGGGGYNFYMYYYATVAMYQGGDAYWREWWPAMRDALLKAQNQNGGWTMGESASYGEAFGSGLALLTLQVPYRCLPIFQRKQD